MDVLKSLCRGVNQNPERESQDQDKEFFSLSLNRFIRERERNYLSRVVSLPCRGIHAPFRSRVELVSGVVSHGSPLSLLLRS